MTFAGTVTSAAALLVLIFLWAPVKGLMFTPNSGSMILVRNNVTATTAALMCYPPESTVHGEVRLAKAVIDKAPLSVSLDAATFLPEAVLLSGASAAPSPPPWEAPSAERQRAPPPIPADRCAAADKKGLSWRAKARFCLVLAVPMLIIVFVLISKPTRARAECDCVTDSRSLLLPSYPASPIIVGNSSPEERSSPSMGPPQPATGIISIEACARPIAVDHRISLPYYFRIAGTLLRQAKIYRDEKNILDLYVILLRYTSLLCETIPKHRDYPVFKSREAEFVRNANSSTLIDVVNELESLKPVVKQQIFEHNRRGTPEANGLNGIHAANHWTEKNPPTTYSTQPFVGSNNGSLQKFSSDGRHHMAPLPSVQTDRQIRKQFSNLPFPKEETLARHSILGPNGLHGQWTGPVAAIKVQYPSNLEFTQSDMTSLVPATLNQDGLHGPIITYPESTTKDNDDMQSVLSLDDGRWSAPAEECTSAPSVSLEGELSQLNIRQPSPPPVLAEIHPERRPISPSRVADPTPGLAVSETGRYQNLHVPVKLMECFLRVAEANTKRSLETCGVLAGTLKKRTFYVTTLIIPKQKSTSDSCEATNEEELFEVQDKGSLFTLGWIHTHPTQSCFLSSIDLHNHYSYQVMLPEAIAIVMAPTDTRKKHGIFHLTDPGGIGVIHDCPERGFHPHKAPLDGSPIYEHCSHVYMNADTKFDMIDLREQ